MIHEKKPIKIKCVYAISIYHFEYEHYNENQWIKGKYSWKWFSGYDGNGRFICASNRYVDAIKYFRLYKAKEQLQKFLANGIQAVIIEIPEKVKYSEAIERRMY